MRNDMMAGLVLILGACASTDAPVAPVAASAAAVPASGASVAQQTCHRETKLGSNFAQTVCESTSDADKRAQMEDLRRQQSRQLSTGQ